MGYNKAAHLYDLFDTNENIEFFLRYASEAGEVLEKAPGVDFWSAGDCPPSMRDSAGRDEVLVGRLRRDRTREGGLLLWLAADSLRLVAANAVKLAEARLRLN